MTTPQVLIVEDEPSLCGILEAIVEKSGFRVITAQDGEVAWALIKKWSPDLVLLDVMIPKIDGFELSRMIRMDPDTRQIPIVMLTAKNEQTQKYEGFNVGANDYITKPFDPVELTLRLKAQLQGRVAESKEHADVLRVGKLEVNSDTFQAKIGDRTEDLTKSQLLILKYLMNRADQVVSSEQLLTDVLGYEPTSGSSDVVRTQIRNLRLKIEDDPGNPQIILTVGRRGYMIRSL